MLNFSANLSTLFQELPLASRFAAATHAGFNAVEVWFPYELASKEVAILLAEHRLQCVGINSPAGDVTAGDWGLAADPGKFEEFKTSAEQAIGYAREIGCSNVHIMAGLLAPQADRTVAWENYLQCIDFACLLAAQASITVMIEPLNSIDRPRYLLNTQAQALEAIETLGKTNLRVMLDLFHLQRGEGNLIERMKRSLPFAAHVQIADNPGRHEPGTGEVNFEAVFKALQDANYAGYIGCEYLPLRTSEESFEWMADLRPA
ncbi:TIM barrel protein [Caballeronia sp. LP006]|uniref:hydroxypyruvate isomerase family protein n=1 Tax=Caballeronia sp. LP006 TaxID=3038552 RepID=UPI00285577AD|nr:TIM barrel protein [Caballeronia sp. LP006]MDR5832328.1 TIM barrel protein [Caballeronia sp. LP006]